jgi:hypothetical protein
MPSPTNVLHAPLGQSPKPRPARKLSRFGPALVLIALSTPLVVFGGWIALADDPLGGEPVVRVAAKIAPKPAAVAAANSASAPASGVPDPELPTITHGAPGAQAGRPTITIINGATGERQQVEIAPNARAAEDAEPFATGTVRVTPVPSTRNSATAPKRQKIQ